MDADKAKLGVRRDESGNRENAEAKTKSQQLKNAVSRY